MESKLEFPQSAILTPYNYFEWKPKIQLHLRSRGLFRITMETEVEPTSAVEKSRYFNRMDEAFGILCFSISPELLFHVESCSTPNEVWKILEELFGKQNEILRMVEDSIAIYRNHRESFSLEPEDPHVASLYATNYVQGLLETHGGDPNQLEVAACYDDDDEPLHSEAQEWIIPAEAEKPAAEAEAVEDKKPENETAKAPEEPKSDEIPVKEDEPTLAEEPPVATKMVPIFKSNQRTRNEYHRDYLKMGCNETIASGKRPPRGRPPGTSVPKQQQPMGEIVEVEGGHIIRSTGRKDRHNKAVDWLIKKAKPPLQKKQIPILQRILTRNEINPPTLQELPKMLEKTPSLQKKIALLRTFVSLRGDMKLQPHRGKIKGKVLKSAVHVVVFVGRLTNPKHVQAQPVNPNPITAGTPCRWSVKRLDLATQVIEEALKNCEKRRMSRQDVRDAAKVYIGDTGLLDFVLRSLANRIVGGYVVRRAVNPLTKVLEYSIEDVNTVVTTWKGISVMDPVLCQIGRTEVLRDIVYLYKHVLEDFLDLYIADAYFGLLTVGPEGGLATPLTTEAGGVPLRFTNDLDIDDYALERPPDWVVRIRLHVAQQITGNM